MASPESEAEELVRRLYDPGYSSQAGEIQQQLQQLQKSRNGWHLAAHFSNSPDTRVRFFAALTYTVKLNQEGPGLEEDQLRAIQQQLLAWFTHLVAQNERLLVIRKLSSTLVTLFVLPNSAWKRCLQQLVCSLSSGEVKSELLLDEIMAAENPKEGGTLVNRALPFINAWQMEVILIFSTTLAEDALRIDHSSQKLQYAHKRVETNINDAIDVLQHSLSYVQGQSADFIKSIFQCCLSWINYACEEYLTSNNHVQRLRLLMRPMMTLLTDHEAFESAADFFTDIFSSHEDFIKDDDLTFFSTWYLTHSSIQLHLDDLEQSGSADPEPIAFGLLVMAFSSAATKLLVQANDDLPEALPLVHRITRTQTYDTVDQSLSNAVVDFWEAFVLSQSAELNVENGGDDETKEVQDQKTSTFVQSHWLQALEELCIGTRLEFDETGEFLKVNSDDPFAEFRTRVREAAHSSVEVFPLPVLNKLVMMVLRAHEPGPDNLACNQLRAWDNLESALNCLVGIADTLHYQPIDADAEDESLQMLFGSFLYQDLTNNDIFVPIKVRRSAIYILGEHDVFLGRHPQFLLTGLDILFRCLEYEPLMETAAKAVYKLCDPNRNSLNGVIEQFSTSAEAFFVFPVADQTAKEYVAGALAAVIQGLPDTAEQGRRTLQLLNMTEKYFQEQLRLAEASEDREANRRLAISTTLGQLKAIGKAFQSPTDTPIAIDSDDEALGKSSFWTSNEAQHIKARIVQFVLFLYRSAPDDENVLEGACDTIRSGYRELEPGPFVFPPQVTTDLVTSVPLNHRRVDLAILAATALLTSSTSTPSKLDIALPLLLSYVCSVVKHLHTPSTDPETAAACLDFFARLVTRWLAHFTALPEPDAELVLAFSLRALDGADVLPKRAAAVLWSFLLTLRDEQIPPSNPQFREHLVAAVGPRLTSVFINAYGGKALRSELEALCEPFKKLVAFRYTSPSLPKAWIEQSLFSGEFPSERVSVEEKKRFLSQVLSLRGGSRTNGVVKEFWLACRGTPVAYG